MKKIVFLLLFLASPAWASTILFDTFRDGHCAVNPGLNGSSVVCDLLVQEEGPSPKRQESRQRIIMLLGPRGGLKCVTIDLYDPSIPTIRDGRILETHSQCYR